MSEMRPTESGNELSAELVKKVADKVYAMLLIELRRERERRRVRPIRKWKK